MHKLSERLNIPGRYQQA